MQKIFTILIIIMLQYSSAYATSPKVEEITTTKGYKAWIIEDDYLPIISIKLAFTKAGSAYDDIRKQGISYLISGLLNEGAGGMSSLEYRQKLEELSTSISFDADSDNFYISLKTLTKNLEESLELLNLTLTKPNLEEKVITRVRNQILLTIEKKQEDPTYIASRKFASIIFGDHPYARSRYGTLNTIKSINLDDLIDFKNENFTKKNLVISIVGDIKKSNAITLLDKYLKLPKNYSKDTSHDAVQINSKSNEIYIYKNIPQSIVIFGGQGLTRNDKYFYPAYIMNHILGGGGFESRFMHEIREKNGLAYTIYSYLETLNEAGLFSGYVGTDNAKVIKSIKLIKQEIKDIYENGVTKQELQDAKDYLINSFPLKMTKNSKLATFLLTMQLENLGMDFLEKRNQYVNNVTLEDINTISKQLMDVDKMTFIIVGANKQ